MGAQATAIRAQLEHATADVVRSLILEIDSELRKSADAGGTPVDTGHARANWVPSIGAAFDGIASSSAEHEAGVAQIIGYQLADGAAWLANNVPYINLLDLGFSPQAAAGFVEVAIARAMATVQAHFQHVDIGINGYTGQVGGTAAGNLAAAYSPFGGDDD